MSWFNRKRKPKSILADIDKEWMEKYSVPCSITYPTDHFDRFVKGSCRDYDSFFKINPENRSGRFYGNAYMYMGRGYRKHESGKEFTTLYDAYYYARHMAYKIDKYTYHTGCGYYGVEWEIKGVNYEYDNRSS